MPQSDLDQLQDEMWTAKSGPPEGYAEVLERVLTACSSTPAASEYFDELEIHDELAEIYERLGRVEEALQHADVLAAAKWNCAPDPRCRRAEILMRAGRVAEAAPIWDEVARDTPDDVWVYNNAGIEYASADDHEAALTWLTKGLQIALETNDPERLVDQLTHFRGKSLTATGREPDVLQKHAARFLAEQERARLGAPTTARAVPADVSGAAERAAWAWFPADEYAEAHTHWPDLADSELMRDADQPVTHAEYCWRMERRLRSAAAAGMRGIHVAPIRWTEFTTWHTQNPSEEDDPARLRANYAAQLALDRSRVIAWPPARNAPCWCGSGRKYKKCCAAPGPDGSR